jgi:hypothetical protein
MPAAHQNAVTYPSTAAWRSTSGAGPRSTRKSVVADTANVLNSAVPIEPPTCCDVLTIAEATPTVPPRHAEGGRSEGGPECQPKSDPDQDPDRARLRDLDLAVLDD